MMRLCLSVSWREMATTKRRFLLTRRRFAHTTALPEVQPNVHSSTSAKTERRPRGFKVGSKSFDETAVFLSITCAGGPRTFDQCGVHLGRGGRRLVVANDPRSLHCRCGR